MFVTVFYTLLQTETHPNANHRTNECWYIYTVEYGTMVKSKNVATHNTYVPHKNNSERPDTRESLQKGSIGMKSEHSQHELTMTKARIKLPESGCCLGETQRGVGNISCSVIGVVLR